MQQHTGWKINITEILGFVILTILDQWTKALCVAELKGQSPYVLLDGVLELRYIENRGAAFSLFQDATVFFWVIAVVAMSFIAWFLWKMPAERRFVPIRIILVFIAAGAMGNLIDRIQLRYVRDFIYFSLINFPVFNVADIYVTVSVAFLILLVLFYYKDSDFAWMERHTHDK